METVPTTSRPAAVSAVPITPGFGPAIWAAAIGMMMTVHVAEAAAPAPVVSHVVSGQWQSTDFSDPSNPGCSMGGSGPVPGGRLIMGASRLHPDPMNLVVRRTGWSIPPGSRIKIVATFPGGASMDLAGTGNGITIDILLGADQLAPWIHEITASSEMQLSFGGSEPSWTLDLTGTSKVVNAMYDCFRSHQIVGVGAPFTVGMESPDTPVDTTQPFQAPASAPVPRVPTATSAPPPAAALVQPAYKQPQAILTEPSAPRTALSGLPMALSAPGDKVLMSWSGSGRMQTRPFHVAGPWEFQWARASGYFSAILHPASGSDDGKQMLANGSNADSSTSYQPRGGDFYFEFDSNQQWTARIVALPELPVPPALPTRKEPVATAPAPPGDTAAASSPSRTPSAGLAAPLDRSVGNVGQRMAEMPAPYEPSMEIAVVDPLRLVIHGRTNLPDGTGLNLKVTRPESGFVAESEVKVTSGQFETEALAEGRGLLNPGRYSATVSMSPLELQSPKVRATLGTKGERMSGPLVVRSETDGEGSTLNYRSTFDLAGTVDPNRDAAAKVRADSDTRDWYIKSCFISMALVDKGVKSGAVAGPEMSPDERRKWIDKCIDDARIRPIP